jgi:hypothetical protein
MTAWQSIDTAPKDGSEFLGWNGVTHDPWFWHADPRGKRPCWARHFRGITDDRRQPPTHWMPLPEPPK